MLYLTAVSCHGRDRTQAEQTRGRAATAAVAADSSSASSSASEPRRRQASVVVVDRTLDLAAAASRGGSLLQRIISSLPKTGSTTPYSPPPQPPLPPSSNSNTLYSSPPRADSYSSRSNTEGLGTIEATRARAATHRQRQRRQQWSPIALAHQQDVGVILPALAPGLGLPSSATTAAAAATSAAESGNPSGAYGGGYAGGREGEPQLAAMKALAGFSWPAPTSLCHSATGWAARSVVHSMACLGEEEGQAALVAVLERCSQTFVFRALRFSWGDLEGGEGEGTHLLLA